MSSEFFLFLFGKENDKGKNQLYIIVYDSLKKYIHKETKRIKTRDHFKNKVNSTKYSFQSTGLSSALDILVF